MPADDFPRRWRFAGRKTRRFWLPIGALVAFICALIALLFARPGFIFQREDATWLALQERGVLRVGLDPSFPPFEALDAAGAPVGFDVDLAAAFAQRWGVDVELVALGYDSLLDAIRTAQVDMVISALPFDERLTEDVHFSSPYFDAGMRLATRGDSAIAAVDDLAGKRVAVEWGSAGDMIARRLQREDRLNLTIVPFDTPQEAVAAAVDDPQIDALLIDQVSLRLAQGDGAPLVSVGPPIESNPYVIASPLRAHRLAAEIETALAQMQTEGALTALENRWFGTMEQAKEPQE